VRSSSLTILSYLGGPLLGFLAGPGIAFMGRDCVVDIPGGCMWGLLLGGIAGWMAGNRLCGVRLTLGRMMLLIAGLAVYLAVFAPFWSYLLR
jgi:hypothetical protein